MRALLQPIYGESETLVMGDIATPKPARGQVLIRVAAASVNAADVFLMRGVPRMVRLGNGLLRPNRRRLGMDVAGVVVGVGPGVTRWQIGDHVFGQGTATFAEFAVAKDQHLARLPDGVRPEHASTLAIAGTAAMRAVEVARVAPGQRVIVTGVAGGVGQFAAQLAALRGAEVIGVCSGRNVERVRKLGIEHVIDYETQSPLNAAAPYDAVIDNAGGVRIREWRRVVARGGSILPNSGVPGPDGGALMRVAKAQWHGLVSPHRVRVFSSEVTSARLEELGRLLASERIRVLIDTVYALDRAPVALARVGTHHARGKVVVSTSTAMPLAG